MIPSSKHCFFQHVFFSFPHICFFVFPSLWAVQSPANKASIYHWVNAAVEKPYCLCVLTFWPPWLWVRLYKGSKEGATEGKKCIFLFLKLLQTKAVHQGEHTINIFCMPLRLLESCFEMNSPVLRGISLNDVTLRKRIVFSLNFFIIKCWKTQYWMLMLA